MYYFQSTICHPHIILEILLSSHSLSCTGFSKSLYKTICFDHTIKAFIPTPTGLHQPINGSLELAHFVSTFRIDKTFWLHHIQLFFNKSIKEELYIMQPESFVDLKGANKVWKLQRSIYALVEASRSWNIPFDEVIKAYGFTQTYGEACIYKKVSGSSVAFLILYVDDILLIGNDIEFLDSIK